MAFEEGPPSKKQALDTGQGLAQGSTSGSQDADRSLEQSLLDSVSFIHNKLELCLSQNCLCSVEENEVGIQTLFQFFLDSNIFWVSGANLCLPVSNPITESLKWIFTQAEHSR